MNTYTHSLGKAPQVVLSGIWDKKADPVKELSTFVEGMLQAAGEEIVTLMKKETKPFDYEKTLTNSIAWRTAVRPKSIPNTAHLIAAPLPTNAVDIGSAAPHAYYREYGAGPHRKADGSAEFIASMRKWVAKVIGISTDANASPKEKAHFWAIVNKIRSGNTAQLGMQGYHPFVSQTEPKIPAIIIPIANAAMTRYWEHMAKKYKV